MFKEQLPPNCPPSTAIDQSWDEVYRLVREQSVSEEDFRSHAALGTMPRRFKGTCRECRFSSCSLVTEKNTGLNKLPNMKKFGYIASLSIPEGSGKSEKQGYHIDMWFFENCSPSVLVSNVEPKELN